MDSKKRAGFMKADAIVCRIVKYYSYIAVATILIMGFLATADVVTSKLFGSAIPVTNDVVKWFIVPTCFCLLAEVQLNGGLMQVDLFSRRYSPKACYILKIVTAILGCAVFGFAGVCVSKLTIKHIVSHEMSSMSAYAMPLWPFSLFCALSLVLLFIALIWTVLRAIFASDTKADGSVKS